MDPDHGGTHLRSGRGPGPVKKDLRCPTCRKRVEPETPFFPFCSERCRLLDLGRWLDGNYRIAGEKTSQTGETPEE